MKPLAILVAAMALALATASTAQAGIQLSKILPNPAVAPVGQTLADAEFVVVKNMATRRSAAQLLAPTTPPSPPMPAPEAQPIRASR
jgi:hypothetical protein